MQTIYARCHSDCIKCNTELQLKQHFLKATILHLYIIVKGVSVLCAFASPLLLSVCNPPCTPTTLSLLPEHVWFPLWVSQYRKQMLFLIFPVLNEQT